MVSAGRDMRPERPPVASLSPCSRRPARIGLGYDGSPPADRALAIARRLLEAGRGEVERLDVAYVDDSAAASYESDGEVIASRRGAVIAWWLGDLVGHLPADVRPPRLIGDPTVELAELSDDLDLLVIGTRGRASLRRAFTGSVSRGLIARTRCPLLVVPSRPADGGPGASVSDLLLDATVGWAAAALEDSAP